MILVRTAYLQAIRSDSDYPIVALPGRRQVGKTTLALLYAESLDNQGIHHFDLESPADLARLSNPELALSPLAW